MLYSKGQLGRAGVLSFIQLNEAFTGSGSRWAEVADVVSGRTEFWFPRPENEGFQWREYTSTVGWSVNQGPVPSRYPKEVTLELKNVYVLGDGCVFSERGEPILGGFFDLSRPRRSLATRSNEIATIEEPVIHALVKNPAYGHWIMNRMPRIVSSLRNYPQSQVLTNELSWSDDDLFFSVGEPEVTRVRYDQVTFCSSLILSSSAFVTGETKIPDYSRYHEIRKTIDDRRVYSGSKGVNVGRKIYLSRKSGWRREGILNKEVAEGILREEGFEIVYPENHSWMEQLKLFDESSVIASEAGSAITTALLSPMKGRRIMILRPNLEGGGNSASRTNARKLSEAFGFELHLLNVGYPVNGRVAWQVDADELKNALLSF